MLYAKIEDNKVNKVDLLPNIYRGKNPLAMVPVFKTVYYDIKTGEEFDTEQEGEFIRSKQVETGEFVKCEDDYTITAFNSAFTDDELKLFGYLPYKEIKEKVEWFEYELDIVYTIKANEVIGYKGKDSFNNETLFNMIRQKRDALLDETDILLSKLSLPDRTDSPNIEALKTYRKQLRDITKNLNDPTKIVWPTLEA